ncbi:Asp/Glu racemase [Rhizodiscina lignyota]|uniref:Asp/Glu racemase n=1 Tax=Rhizodiscina lignyota TaxID=1504668 RepID=A0A9P4LZF5_9PEZI|nr:Asp/Glu racemase [Rhizodiscina lignyota]
MVKQIRLGVLVPSSNTALEPITQEIISSISDDDLEITVHFSRFTVKEISLTPTALNQFKLEPIITAAQLLADAKVDCIGWSGTSAGWLGFDHDERLCKEISDATGISCATSTLALNKALKLLGIGEGSKLGLVTPYLSDVQTAIMEKYAGIGIVIDKSVERHLEISANHSIRQVSAEQLGSMVREVKEGGAHVITTFCTNLVAARYAEQWEREMDVVVLDTVATVVWDMLKMVGVDTKKVQGWGKMFEL